MTLVLDRHDSGDSPVGLLLVVLTPGETPAARRAFAGRFGDLDGPQREAVASFLRSGGTGSADDLDANQARIALERYWGP